MNASKHERARDLLLKIYSKVQVAGTATSNGSSYPSSQYSSHWEWYLRSKGAYHSLESMLNMRHPTSSVTRGFGLDRRFSPSYDYYVNQSVYRDILSISEPDFGNPEKPFFGLNDERRSGIFLRNACYAYNIITNFSQGRDKAITVLEIGPGFGMLAYILKQYYKNARLVLVDLPETLCICASYLENTLPKCAFLYWPADTDTSFADADVILVNAGAFIGGMARYDLVINCDSMSEMTADIASSYLSIIESDINDKGMFFFLNKEGIDKYAMSRPTLYSFSEQWTVKSMQPTYVGFLEDYRHIQMCLQSSDRKTDLPELRNHLLDIAYRYFYNERLECFAMFEFVEKFDHYMAHASEDLKFLLNCIKNQDLDYGVRHVQVIRKKEWDSDTERLADQICMIILCDLLIDAHRQSEAIPISLALAEFAEFFYETWASARILVRLNQGERAKTLWAQALNVKDVPSLMLLRAGKQLNALGYFDLAQKAFRRVVNEMSSPLEKIEAAMRLEWRSPQELKTLFSSLPSYVFSIGYHMVRMADALYKSGCFYEAYEMLLPLLNNRIKAGHYDLFFAAQIMGALGHTEQIESLMQEAIRLGHNDNGFYRKIGLLFEQRGDYSSSLKYLKMSLHIDGSWASTHYDLAQVYRKLNQIDMEVKHLKEALLCGHNKEVDYDAIRRRLSFLTRNRGTGI